jgi:hypothetical protein
LVQEIDAESNTHHCKLFFGGVCFYQW